MVTSETLSRVQTLHGTCGPCACGPTQRHKTTGGRTSQTGGVKSKQTGTEAETKNGQAFRFGPRPNPLVDFRFLSHLAGDLGPRQALSHDLADGQIKAVTVGHVSPTVKTKRLFVDVAEQVERLHADVRAVKTKLQEVPKILHRVGVLPSTYSIA